MSSVTPNDTKQHILSSYLSGKTLKMVLLTASHTPNKDGDTYYSDLIANEVSSSGTNYTTGGQTLDSVTTAVDDANDLAYATFAAEVFPTLTASFRYAAIIDWTGNAATSRVIAEIDYGQTLSPYAGNFTHTPAADGFLKITE
jgi:hypothetical protein